jgi:hypothetical protein
MKLRFPYNFINSLADEHWWLIKKNPAELLYGSISTSDYTVSADRMVDEEPIEKNLE